MAGSASRSSIEVQAFAMPCSAANAAPRAAAHHRDDLVTWQGAHRA
jgi:hypothetical protein